MLVQRKLSPDPTVLQFVPPNDPIARLRRAIYGRYLSQSRRALEALPPGASILTEDRSEHGADILHQLPGQEILHLHWVAALFDYAEFFRRLPANLPVVWTLHDMNPFTGGCHFDDSCGKFAQGCGCCPQLASLLADDFSAKCWKRKITALGNIATDRLHVVAPSRWMTGEARKSPILAKFPISTIPYGLDTEKFKPHDKRQARIEFGIPADAKVILFVADSLEEKRKGLHKLMEAVAELPGQTGACLLSLGRGIETPASGIPLKNLGFLSEDDKLAAAYSAADVFVAPSLQDNFPNTILEAIACGTPVVTFSVGGCAEQVVEGETGLLAKPGDSLALRNAIVALLQNSALREKMSQLCRRAAQENFSLIIQAQRYRLLYESCLS